MESITFTVPFPPTCNHLYVSSPHRKWSKRLQKWYYPRYLSKEALQYKKLVSDLIFYKFPKVKYGKSPIGVYIIVYPPDDNRRRDMHNGEKILFDSIEESGIIDNDCQIVDRSSKIAHKMDKGQWVITIKPFDGKN
jgi:Holliday junction resolvase RusA-like endonuclease